eukprot:GFYU01008042.1.p1 GENE.GFYU01008042.1~~GFYU01008042.1.p1  ORF type:complete len:523 (+),score=117.59 GFYU01008042.1:93-1571(+)
MGDQLPAVAPRGRQHPRTRLANLTIDEMSSDGGSSGPESPHKIIATVSSPRRQRRFVARDLDVDEVAEVYDTSSGGSTPRRSSNERPRVGSSGARSSPLSHPRKESAADLPSGFTLELPEQSAEDMETGSAHSLTQEYLDFKAHTDSPTAKHSPLAGAARPPSLKDSQASLTAPQSPAIGPGGRSPIRKLSSRSHASRLLDVDIPSSPTPSDSGNHVHSMDHEEVSLNFHEVAQKGDLNLLKRMVIEGEDVDCRDEFGRSALHWAAGGGHHQVVKFLLATGADRNAQNQYGWCPLHWAAYHGHTAIVETLIEHGAKVNLTTDAMATPLHEAARMGHADTMKILLKHGSRRNRPNKQGRTPLHIAAWRGNLDAVVVMIEAKADVYARDHDGRAAMDYAVKSGKREVVDVLLACGLESEHIHDAIQLGERERALQEAEEMASVPSVWSKTHKYMDRAMTFFGKYGQYLGKIPCLIFVYVVFYYAHDLNYRVEPS